MGICSLIPYIGPVIGAVPALVVGIDRRKIIMDCRIHFYCSAGIGSVWAWHTWG